MSLNEFLLFLFLKVCTSYVDVVWQLLWFFSLHINYIKLFKQPGEIHDLIKQVKSTQSKFANHIIYHCNPLDFPQIFVLLHFPLLVFVFLLFLFCFLVFWEFFLFSFFFFWKLKIYILIQTRLCGWMNDRNIFTRVISGNKITFFGSTLIRIFSCATLSGASSATLHKVFTFSILLMANRQLL